MSLSAWEQHSLDSIGDVLAGSDPGLAVLLATFTDLASGEEMPAAEQIMPGPRLATWLASRRRRRPRRGGMHRCRSRLGQALTARWTMPLLWLLLAVALVSTALALSGGASQGPCPQSWSVSCASTVPVHASRPVTRSPVASEEGRAASRSGQLLAERPAEQGHDPDQVVSDTPDSAARR